jgi:hypothetical protein
MTVCVGTGDVFVADAAEDELNWVAEPDVEDGAEEEFKLQGFCATAAPFPARLHPGTPGDWMRSESCCPSGTGPDGFAGQLPGGFRGAFWPNGPSANLLGSTPWNWHWKSPLSSALRGFCWQYGTLRESGWQFTGQKKVG